MDEQMSRNNNNIQATPKKVLFNMPLDGGSLPVKLSFFSTKIIQIEPN